MEAGLGGIRSIQASQTSSPEVTHHRRLCDSVERVKLLADRLHRLRGRALADLPPEPVQGASQVTPVYNGYAEVITALSATLDNIECDVGALERLA